MGRTAERTEWHFEMVGRNLALDFANTVNGNRPTKPVERLNGYADLLSFARQAGIVDEAEARRLRREAERRPRDAEAALREAVALREAIYRVFEAIAESREPTADDVALLNASLSRALARRRVVRRDGGFALAFEEDPRALDAVLWPVAASAADVLAHGDLGRVRICGAHACGDCSWLFYDDTKSGTRRWCTMKDCGNRAKARRHYERQRAGC